MPRLEFTAATKREALLRSGGICECHLIPHVFETACGCTLGTGNTFYEHIVCDQLKPDNSIENCAVLTRTCWKFKTATYDLPVIGIYGGHARKRAAKAGGRGTRDVWDGGHKAAASEALGVDWMTLAELSEAIPPAYAEHIGRAAMAIIAPTAVAAE